MNDIGHQKLYGELLPFITKMEDEKAIIRQDAVYIIQSPLEKSGSKILEWNYQWPTLTALRSGKSSYRRCL